MVLVWGLVCLLMLIPVYASTLAIEGGAETETPQETQLDVVFLLDNSYSVQGEQNLQMEQALALLDALENLAQLFDVELQVAVATFSGQLQTTVPLQPVDEEVRGAIRFEESDNSETNFLPPLLFARNQFYTDTYVLENRYQAAVLFSDGMPDPYTDDFADTLSAALGALPDIPVSLVALAPAIGPDEIRAREIWQHQVGMENVVSVTAGDSEAIYHGLLLPLFSKLSPPLHLEPGEYTFTVHPYLDQFVLAFVKGAPESNVNVFPPDSEQSIRPTNDVGLLEGYRILSPANGDWRYVVTGQETELWILEIFPQLLVEIPDSRLGQGEVVQITGRLIRSGQTTAPTDLQVHANLRVPGGDITWQQSLKPFAGAGIYQGLFYDTPATGTYTATITATLPGYPKGFVARDESKAIVEVFPLPNIRDFHLSWHILAPGAPVTLTAIVNNAHLLPENFILSAKLFEEDEQVLPNLDFLRQGEETFVLTTSLPRNPGRYRYQVDFLGVSTDGFSFAWKEGESFTIPQLPVNPTITPTRVVDDRTGSADPISSAAIIVIIILAVVLFAWWFARSNAKRQRLAEKKIQKQIAEEQYEEAIESTFALAEHNHEVVTPLFAGGIRGLLKSERDAMKVLAELVAKGEQQPSSHLNVVDVALNAFAGEVLTHWANNPDLIVDQLHALWNHRPQGRKVIATISKFSRDEAELRKIIQLAKCLDRADLEYESLQEIVRCINELPIGKNSWSVLYCQLIKLDRLQLDSLELKNIAVPTDLFPGDLLSEAQNALSPGSDWPDRLARFVRLCEKELDKATALLPHLRFLYEVAKKVRDLPTGDPDQLKPKLQLSCHPSLDLKIREEKYDSIRGFFPGSTMPVLLDNLGVLSTEKIGLRLKVDKGKDICSTLNWLEAFQNNKYAIVDLVEEVANNNMDLEGPFRSLEAETTDPRSSKPLVIYRDGSSPPNNPVVRRSIVAMIEDTLTPYRESKRGRVRVFTGMIGAGKTTFLKKLEESARDDMLPIYVDLSRGREIPQAKILGTYGVFFNSVIDSLQGESSGLSELSFKPRRDLPVSREEFGQGIRRLQALLPVDKPLVFLIDELGTLRPGILPDSEPEILACDLVSLFPQSLFVITTTHTSTEPNWIKEVTKAPESGDVKELQFPYRDEIQSFMAQRDLNLTAFARAFVWRVTGGWPYLIDLVLTKIGSQVDNPSNTIVDVGIAKESVSRLVESRLEQKLMQGLGQKEQVLLKNMADDDKARDVLHQSGIISHSYASTINEFTEECIKGLVRKQVFEEVETEGKNRDGLRLRVGLFAFKEVWLPGGTKNQGD